MLAEPENNLFIVGDDDQSIYGFRGAKPGIMLSFPKRFPDTKQIVLGVNYRCSDEIMKAAERLIGKNNERYEKHIVANKGKEQPVHMKKCENLPDEAEKIVAQIQMYQKEGIAYQEMQRRRTPPGRGGPSGRRPSAGPRRGWPVRSAGLR